MFARPDLTVKLSVETRAIARVADGVAFEARLDEQRALLAVVEDLHEAQDVARRLPFRPELAARARPEGHEALLVGDAQGVGVHEADHQDLVGVRLLDDGGHEAIRVELQLRDFHVSLTGTPLAAMHSFRSRTVYDP